MIQNRSAPAGPVVPILIYADVDKAMRWLCGAFGFTERLRTPAEPDGTIHHAQLNVGQGAVILTGQREGAAPQSLYVQVPDVDAHCAHAKQFGARILRPPKSCEFGERQYTAEDLAAYQWTFSQSIADVKPEEWGAIALQLKIESKPETPSLPCLCYLEIPAVDVHQSAGFYEKVLGWNIRGRNSDRPAFDAANHSGAFVTGLAITREAGLRPSYWVDGIDETLARVVAHGGTIVEPVHHDHPDSTSWVATFRDPAGNMMRLYQEPPREGH